MKPGEAIESVRLRLNIQRRQLADTLGVSYQTVRRWELGEHGLSFRSYLRMAHRLRLSPQEHTRIISSLSSVSEAT